MKLEVNTFSLDVISVLPSTNNNNKAASSEQFAEALMLFRVISNDIGELSESLRQDLSEDFSFLDMHIEKIAKHLDSKGEQNVK